MGDSRRAWGRQSVSVTGMSVAVRVRPCERSRAGRGPEVRLPDISEGRICWEARAAPLESGRCSPAGDILWARDHQVTGAWEGQTLPAASRENQRPGVSWAGVMGPRFPLPSSPGPCSRGSLRWNRGAAESANSSPQQCSG